jgi:hypothetical protein
LIVVSYDPDARSFESWENTTESTPLLASSVCKQGLQLCSMIGFVVIQLYICSWNVSRIMLLSGAKIIAEE